MKSLARRLRTLEGGPLNPFEPMSDDELVARINEINAELRAHGYPGHLIEPKCANITELAASIAMLQRENGLRGVGALTQSQTRL